MYGNLYLKFQIQGNQVILLTIEPQETLLQFHRAWISVYKGIPILSPKDKFKVDLLCKMKGVDKYGNN